VTKKSLPALARLLRDLRGERYSLRDVEQLTDKAVSNVYLSQLETGKRSDPNPRVLVALAKLYEVSPIRLFEAAGYVDEPAESAINVAYKQVLADKNFQFGTRLKGTVDQASKRVIIELYEKATGKTLLSDELDDGEDTS
jgi:transcriptional regulator with XRE-family HTH domain